MSTHGPIDRHRTAGTMTSEEYRGEVTARTTEAAFQSQVIAMAHQFGWRVAHFRGVRTQRKDGSVRYQTPVQADGAGFPDLVLVRGKRLVVAELKAQRGRVAEEQRDWLYAFEFAEVETYTWKPSDWPEIETALR